MSSFQNRMIGAAKLDQSIFEEVEHDTGALPQALGVVLISSLAAGIGTIGVAGLSGLLWGTITAVLGWLAWAYLCYFIGTKLLPEPQTRSNPGELLRTVGFASSPGLIRVLGVVPGIGGILFWVAGVWMLVAMVIGVKAALDYSSTFRAVGVCVIGWIVQVIIIYIFLSFVGNPSPQA
ncbi:MAG: hypothetical protein ACOC0U_00925 [Desulfovibrionales bacterium]